MFVDNSGADVVLGMLPIARELARRGCKVVIAANETPSINDVTASELTSDLIPRVCDLDDVFAKAVKCGAISVCSSGSDLPVIDLRRVSRGLANQAEDADLVILEGMGRAVETNLEAAFDCDALRIGMVKHPEVAQCLGGELYDCVCRFEAAGYL
jgi:type II pantothenate kinase